MVFDITLNTSNALQSLCACFACSLGALTGGPSGVTLDMAGETYPVHTELHYVHLKTMQSV